MRGTYGGFGSPVRRSGTLELIALVALAACSPTPTVVPNSATPSLVNPSASPTSSADTGIASVEPTPTKPTQPPDQPTSVAVANAIAFWTPSRGIAGGADTHGAGEVSLTSDGGRTWSVKKPGLPPIGFVTVVGSSDAWAITTCTRDDYWGACAIWRSLDAGSSWTKVRNSELQAISFVDALHGWGVLDTEPTAGGASTSGVFRTADGGRTWSEISGKPCGQIGGPTGVSFVTAERGWVTCLGDAGTGMAAKGVLETRDAGRTWTIESAVYMGDQAAIGSIAASDYLIGLSMRPSGVGMAWEGRGSTIRTADGGRTWVGMPPGSFDVAIPLGGWALTDLDWYYVIWDGDLQDTALWATHDGGLHWSSISAVPPGV
ncbi:MAG TPA: hypothetical protein VFW20_06300 [Candidatus Limnocylindrales bacterium]|nr:hypothetical protein [Candidatus Limnocylindrales bacterium]